MLFSPLHDATTERRSRGKRLAHSGKPEVGGGQGEPPTHFVNIEREQKLKLVTY